MVPDRVADFRQKYRAEEIGPRYSGVAHFLFTTISCLSAIGLALSGLDHPTPVQFAVVPVAFLVANAGEYFGHKGPMHFPTRGLGAVYKRHSLQHHRFFTHEAMSYESARDVKMVLFPWQLILFFFGGMALPLGAAVWMLFGANVARLFVATLVGYFLVYEMLHFSYHLGDDTFIGRNPLVRGLRRHHRVHHDPARMTKTNFNISFPVCDAIFGTWDREAG
jgi:hypothetical protein